MLDLEIPLIVFYLSAFLLFLTTWLDQGILPTLIIVLVHFDMVPGTSTSKRYAQNVTSSERSHVMMTTIRTDTTMSVGDRMEFKSGSVASGFDDVEQGPRDKKRSRSEIEEV